MKFIKHIETSGAVSESKRVYCVAPWTQVYLRPDGFFSVCCRAKRNALSISARSVEEYWNGDDMKRLRVAMMNNDPPKDICFNCVNNVSSVVPARVKYNERARAYGLIGEIFALTSPDGTTSFRPTALDIRTNLCNLKCRMCSPGSSSAIYSEYKAVGWDVPALGPNAQEEDKLVFDDDTLKDLHQISWAGGEPFMSKVHWSIMQSLVRLGNTRLAVWYNSNFTFPGGTLKRAGELLAHFSAVRIGVSIDAEGKDFDYLRDRADYAEVIENLLHFQKVLPHVRLLIDYTATSLGLFSLPHLIAFCLKNGIGMICKTAVLPPTDWLSVGSLKPDVFQACLDDALKVSEGTVLQDMLVKFVTHVRSHYQPSVPDYERSRRQELVRGASGYLESRIGHLLNPGEN